MLQKRLIPASQDMFPILNGNKTKGSIDTLVKLCQRIYHILLLALCITRILGIKEWCEL